MQIKIKVDDKATVVLNVKEEMSISEFMGVVSLVSKIDKYAYNQKTVVDDIMETTPQTKTKTKKRKKKRRKHMTDGEKKDFVKRWYSSTRPERKKWAEKEGKTYSKLANLVYFHKRSLEKDGYDIMGENHGK